MADETESLELHNKIIEANQLLNEAIAIHGVGRKIVARAILFSGGNDSTTLFHLFKNQATHAVHANTTIGVEETRQFVRDICRIWDIPLLEEFPPDSYADLVMRGGFPGPAMHYKMYQRLKERCLESARRKLVKNPLKERVLWIAGRRKAESARRSNIVEHERRGSMIYVSPLINWTRDNMDEYRSVHEVPRNPVADSLGMSGECLCGSFAEPGEFEHIANHYPLVAKEIVELESATIATGIIPEQLCRWGWGAYRSDPGKQPIKTGDLCSSCDARWDRSKQFQQKGEMPQWPTKP